MEFTIVIIGILVLVVLILAILFSANRKATIKAALVFVAGLFICMVTSTLGGSGAGDMLIAAAILYATSVYVYTKHTGKLSIQD